MLVSDAFGGRGGIAKFNRDFLSALCNYPGCNEVTAVPRLLLSESGQLPDKLSYLIEGINGKLKFILTVVKSILRKRHFDLIICGHINLLPAAFLARLFLKAHVVLIIHGIEAWTPTKKPLCNFLSKRINRFISVSEFTKDRFLEWTGLANEKGTILPNCIEMGLYGPGQKNEILLERYGLHSRKVLMTMGRMSADEGYKGFDEVLEILPALANDIPNISYVIAGDGSDKKRLEKKASSLGIEERVIFTGWIPEAEKADHLRLADVYVMPGKGEGFGIVYLEAMACGVPVVASKVDGSREAVKNGELGIIVDPDNQEEIKSAILKALKQPRGVVPKGLDFFSFANFQQRLHHIIDATICNNKRI